MERFAPPLLARATHIRPGIAEFVPLPLVAGHVIFDLDGTLIDSAPICMTILNMMLAERGSARRVTRDDIAPLLSLGGERLIAETLAEDCGDIADELRHFRAQYATRATPASCLYPGVRAGIKALHAAGFRLSVCSNKPQALCDKTLNDLGLAPYVDFVVGGRADVAAKPARAMIDLILSHHHVSAEKCLFVGDSGIDLSTARGVNMPFIYVTYGYDSQPMRANDVVRCDSFDGVVSRLFELQLTDAPPVPDWWEA